MKKQSIAGIAVQGNRVFLGKRKPGGDLGLKWEFPGGKLEPGETHQEAMIREWMEELNLTVIPEDFMGKTDFTHKKHNFELFAYRITLPEISTLQLIEHTETGWFTVGEIETLDLADSDRKLWSVISGKVFP